LNDRLKTVQTPRDVLTPNSLSLLQSVADAGSFAAAARQLGLVPSAVTYRVRQIEDALDVLLFDRASRQAALTEAGAELLREGARLLAEIDAVANRVRRVAPGWEPVAPTSEAARETDASGSQARVQRLLHRLPEHYARVLELRFLQRLSVTETAEKMGITRGNAKVLQYRALRKAALLGEADG